MFAYATDKTVDNRTIDHIFGAEMIVRCGDINSRLTHDFPERRPVITPLRELPRRHIQDALFGVWLAHR